MTTADVVAHIQVCAITYFPLFCRFLSLLVRMYTIYTLHEHEFSVFAITRNVSCVITLSYQNIVGDVTPLKCIVCSFLAARHFPSELHWHGAEKKGVKGPWRVLI